MEMWRVWRQGLARRRQGERRRRWLLHCGRRGEGQRIRRVASFRGRWVSAKASIYRRIRDSRLPKCLDNADSGENQPCARSALILHRQFDGFPAIPSAGRKTIVKGPSYHRARCRPRGRHTCLRGWLCQSLRSLRSVLRALGAGLALRIVVQRWRAGIPGAVQQLRTSARPLFPLRAVWVLALLRSVLLPRSRPLLPSLGLRTLRPLRGGLRLQRRLVVAPLRATVLTRVSHTSTTAC